MIADEDIVSYVERSEAAVTVQIVIEARVLMPETAWRVESRWYKGTRR